MNAAGKRIAVLLILSGLVLLIGTAGTSDIGGIGTAEIIKRCLCGLGMIATGMTAAYIIEKKENV